MIVRELIAALGKLPPDLDVRVWDHKEDDWADVVVAWKESGSPYVDIMTFDPATQGDPKAVQMPTSPLDAFAKSTGLTRVEVAQARLGDIDASGVLHVPDCACRLRIETGHFDGCPYAAAEQVSPMPGPDAVEAWLLAFEKNREMADEWRFAAGKLARERAREMKEAGPSSCEARALLRDVVDDCAAPENNFRCVVCGAHHVEDDGDPSCSVSKALRFLGLGPAGQSEGEAR